VHVDAPTHRLHHILRCSLLLYHLGIGPANRLRPLLKKLLILIHELLVLLSGLKPPIHHTSARIERLGRRQLKVLMTLKAFNLHDPVVIGRQSTHVLLVPAAHRPLLVRREVLLISDVSQALGHELVALSLLGHVGPSIFHLLVHWNRTEVLSGVARGNHLAHWLHFHNVGIETLGI
jgi:hypothetical protein